MKTPEYQEIKDDHGTRRDGLHTDVSEVQTFTTDDEGAGLVSGQSRDATSSPAARTSQ